MPNYDYMHIDPMVVPACTLGPCFERFESMSATRLATCEICSGPVERLIGAGSPTIFKCGGFYQTDNPKSGIAGTQESNPQDYPSGLKTVESSSQGTLNSQGTQVIELQRTEKTIESKVESTIELSKMVELVITQVVAPAQAASAQVAPAQVVLTESPIQEMHPLQNV